MKHKELAEQAGIGYLYEYEMKWAWLGELEHFAELVRQDERDKCAQDYLQDCCDAIEASSKASRIDEREACAMLCEEWYLSGDVAKAIRARGNE